MAIWIMGIAALTAAGGYIVGGFAEDESTIRKAGDKIAFLGGLIVFVSGLTAIIIISLGEVTLQSFTDSMKELFFFNFP